MKLLIIALAAISFAHPDLSLARGGGHSGGRSSSRSYSSSSRTSVRGYTRKNGTYVAPHQRTTPNDTKSDNWSTKGNVNPNTGKEGTRE